MPTWEFYARGRVQGVGFRWFVQRVAKLHSVYGYVRNLSDGSVYILAEGDEHVLESFRSQVETGAGMARVEELEVNKIESAKKYHEFEIR